ncbi:efflux RND transporter periplasmic adaptor subunit [Prosthecobacter vanneervenii]|uniref:RND family efflux transporter MFP subunit n=1 Tax=Prosthecobacter vanneervenii TaxID=48466 RepID=A0A7W8DJB3_9BACT|nr:efflux RND transporter periplasmic adaptor subunit [Prosthecobacter vanneervenii]MBB5031954.1 RND family efflux transporter MFP subunit [Prosthecobacter vanneervenii]
MKTHGLLLPLIAACGIAYTGISIARTQPRRELTQPPSPAPRSAFATTVAAVGLVEPRSENIAVGSHRPGIVERVLVRAGDVVKAGAPLAVLDQRELNSQLAAARAREAESQAQVTVADATLAEARDLLRFLENIRDTRAISEEQTTGRRRTVDIAAARALAARASLESARAAVEIAQTEIDRSTIRAPIDATVLRVNLRPGETVTTQPVADPYFILGDVAELHVRVDVDEHEAWRLKAGSLAQARVRGNAAQSCDLAFLRFEPYVIPKRSLTGAATERVDTRVLQVIYRLQNHAAVTLYPGQQVDVFIDADGGERIQ